MLVCHGKRSCHASNLECDFKNLGLAPTLMFQEGEHGLDEHKLHMYLSALQSLIPSLFALVLQNAPFSSKATLHGDVPQIEGTELSAL